MSSTASAVFITVPKYVAISPLRKIQPGSALLVSPGALSPLSNSSMSDDGLKCKKRRLDHLTWEEKVQRKKLKNRVAAQTSRDRKKARMEEMEHELKDISQMAEILQNKCESLQAINDSLLEKNQKLDLEVENLRQQLTELQRQQHQLEKKTAANATALNTMVSCAGSGINSNRLTVVTRATEEEQHASVALEDCSALPTLQDMLLVDEEFDAGRLEELAESLLADITADMEAGDQACGPVATEVTGSTKRLLRSVVGTTAECLESSEHSSASTQSCSIKQEMLDIDITSEIKTEADLQQAESTLSLQNESNTSLDESITKVTTTPANSIYAAELSNLPVTPDTVYGTYDAKTNSITIVMEGDVVPVNEAVEEIYCDDIKPPLSVDCIKCPSPAASPSQIYLNVDCSDDEEDDLNFDPIAKFLCPKRPIVSPLAKSPALSLHSIASDHGYESILGSPVPTSMDHFDPGIEDFSWNSSFNELFPSLV